MDFFPNPEEIWYGGLGCLGIPCTGLLVVKARPACSMEQKVPTPPRHVTRNIPPGLFFTPKRQFSTTHGPPHLAKGYVNLLGFGSLRITNLRLTERCRSCLVSNDIINLDENKALALEILSTLGFLYNYGVMKKLRYQACSCFVTRSISKIRPGGMFRVT